MPFLPFDYLVISYQSFDSLSLKDTISFFSECGVRKFIFLLNFDRTRHTVSWIKDRQKLLDQSLRDVHPKGLIVCSFLNLELSEGIVYDPAVERLILNHSPFLFVKIPLFCDDSWIDSDLNYLLFKKKISPILTSFEGNIHTNSQARIAQMLRSQAYRFSLDLNYLTALNSDFLFKQIISREISLLPSISHDVSNYVAITQAFSDLKERVGNAAYTRLARNFLETEKIFID